jgi:hypothetical protein
MPYLRQLDVTTGYVAMPDLRASKVSLLNTSGAALDVRLEGEDGTSELITIPDAKSASIPVVSNAKEVLIKGPGAVSDGVQAVIE